MTNKKDINAGIIIIGNEILSGRTKDQNVSYLALWLNNSLGIKVAEVRIVPDIESKIIKRSLNSFTFFLPAILFFSLAAIE